MIVYVPLAPGKWAEPYFYFSGIHLSKDLHWVLLHKPNKPTFWWTVYRCTLLRGTR